eukprot:CAMPEP_0180521334 /NCGR_PEP_ID=MMETSP1036_2-20121128/56758_1 /TAXON_ID=632150 /ORGANISM="Azadinium spinosum, Strain 3D9" /LENGTH=55 /DNA_ID=CAMNT_0022533917 /DNA_START=73 /DNA_END=240 /DNA_ORIENTATION=+
MERSRNRNTPCLSGRVLGDMQQPVVADAHVDEGAEVHDVAHHSLQAHAGPQHLDA